MTIILPPDARRSTTRDIDFITLEQAETAAQLTGQLRDLEVEFSDDGENWTEAWVPAEGSTHPTHARATVVRRLSPDESVRRRVVVRWDEYEPDITDPRYEDWLKMPTTLLGKCAKVSALRGVFRDVIGNRYEPAELHQAGGAA